MRVSSYAVARPSYYDRNAAAAFQLFSASAAPHLQTTRWTATIAAGKKQFVELGSCSVYRLTAATTADLYEARVFVGTVVMVRALSALNVVGTIDTATQTGNVTLYAGDVISGETYDISTVGGTIYYVLGYRATEFDA